MLKSYLIFIFLFILFSGCNSTQNTTSKKVVVTNWIGYTPLLYAYENGDLDKFNIEIIVTSSLQTSYNILKSNDYDGMALTQKEHQIINDNAIKNNHYVPIALFDRSYGGDAIVSNLSSQELNTSSEDILVILEKDTINTLVFDYFKQLPIYKNKNFKTLNMNQENILNSDYCGENSKPIVVVTYEPYLSKFLNKNFKVIESTKNDQIAIFDYLVFKENLLTKNEIKEIQKILSKAIHTLNKNPKEYFDVVKIYLQDISYSQFQNTLKTIIFIDEKNQKEMLQLIKNKNIFNPAPYLEQ